MDIELLKKKVISTIFIMVEYCENCGSRLEYTNYDKYRCPNCPEY